MTNPQRTDTPTAVPYSSTEHFRVFQLIVLFLLLTTFPSDVHTHTHTHTHTQSECSLSGTHGFQLYTDIRWSFSTYQLCCAIKIVKPELPSDWNQHRATRAAETVTWAVKHRLYLTFLSPPHSCEPSLDAHIKIIEVLVTSEWSESQAAPGS